MTFIERGAKGGGGLSLRLEMGVAQAARLEMYRLPNSRDPFHLASAQVLHLRLKAALPA